MKALFVLLGVLFLVLQYKLWFGPGGYTQVLHMQKQIAAVTKQNDALQQRNSIIMANVDALKHNNSAIESRARTELGMVKQGEVFYQVIGS